MRVLARATNTAEFSIGSIIILCGPSPSLNSGAMKEPSCRARVGFGGRMGGSCKTAGYESRRPCSLRSSYIVSGIF